MAKDSKDRIGRNLTISFKEGDGEDAALKERLNQLLKDEGFANRSDLVKHFLRRGLAARDKPAAQPGVASTEEDEASLRRIEKQLTEIRKHIEELGELHRQVGDIDYRTRKIRPAISEGVAMLLVQLAWDEKAARKWTAENVLRNPEAEGG